MKLAICSQGELFGGVERHILDLCLYLRRNELPDPLVLLFCEGELARRLRAAGFTPELVPGNSRYDWAMVGRVAARLAAHGATVLHTHGYKATVVGALAAPRAGCRVVKTEHGKREARLTRPLGWLKSHLNHTVEQGLTRRRVDHVCYVTGDIADFYAASHRDLDRSVVHNGIDPWTRELPARPAELAADTWNVGIVGRITAVKGIPFAVEALTRPEVADDTVLHVLGTGPQTREIEQLSERLGVSGQVRWHGFRDDVEAWLAHLDLLLMPSFHEGLPYTLLEAWTLGCPIVASRVGGLAEVLPEGPATRLVDVGDIAGLARAVAGVRVLAGGGRPPLPPCSLTLDAMGGAYLEIYRSLADVTDAPRPTAVGRVT